MISPLLIVKPPLDSEAYAYDLPFVVSPSYTLTRFGVSFPCQATRKVFAPHGVQSQLGEFEGSNYADIATCQTRDFTFRKIESGTVFSWICFSILQLIIYPV